VKLLKTISLKDNAQIVNAAAPDRSLGVFLLFAIAFSEIILIKQLFK